MSPLNRLSSTRLSSTRLSSTRLSSTIDKKWTSYALAAGTLALAPNAQGGVVVNTVNIDLFTNEEVESALLDVDGDGVQDFEFFADPVGSDTYVDSLVLGNALLVDAASAPAFATAFQPGDTIGPGSDTFNLAYFLKTTKGTLDGNWPNDIDQFAYLGFQFDISGSTHYGWAKVSTEIGSAALKVTEVGYETDPNTAVTIPGAEIPEPASMALMLLGAAGIAVLKKRRSSAGN